MKRKLKSAMYFTEHFHFRAIVPNQDRRVHICLTGSYQSNLKFYERYIILSGKSLDLTDVNKRRRGGMFPSKMMFSKSPYKQDVNKMFYVV